MDHSHTSTSVPNLKSADHRAADTVVKAISESIFSGELAVGDLLPSEREIVERFHISRTVAREAVNILSGKGLIEARPRHRPVVIQPNVDVAFGVMGGLVQHMLSQKGGIKQLFETRIFVESGLVRQAAIQASKSDIANLRAALKKNEDSIENSEQFYKTDREFHSVLYTIPNNPVFPSIHRSFSNWLGDHWIQMARLPDRNQRNYAAHAAILNAILSRDPDEAEQLLVTHLNDAWAQVVDTFTDL